MKLPVLRRVAIGIVIVTILARVPLTFLCSLELKCRQTRAAADRGTPTSPDPA
jgi:hypothetical protein